MKQGVCHIAPLPASAPWWPSILCLAQGSAAGRRRCQSPVLLSIRLTNANLLLQDVIVEKTSEEGVGGVDYSFECIGSVEVWHAENYLLWAPASRQSIAYPPEQPGHIYLASPPAMTLGGLQRQSARDLEDRATSTMPNPTVRCPVCR